MSDAARAIRTCASEWLERRVSGDWSDADQTELDTWIAASPAHRVAYLRVQAAWDKADRLVVLHAPSFANTRANTKHNTFPAFRMAAAVAVLAVIGLGVFVANPFASAPVGTTYATTIGGRKTVTLPDGSRIELNTDTSLRLALDGKRRAVFLEKGEAFFHVAHDAARPFVVTIGQHRVVDLGTEFLVRRNTKGVEVALVEGLAQFDRTDAARLPPTVLTPGDVVVATARETSVTRKTVQALKDELSWRRGVLVFYHTTLAEAVDELNRYNTQKIVIADAKAGALKINGTFPANDSRLFGRVAKLALGVSVEQRGNNIVISH